MYQINTYRCYIFAILLSLVNSYAFGNEATKGSSMINSEDKTVIQSSSNDAGSKTEVDDNTIQDQSSNKNDNGIILRVIRFGFLDIFPPGKRNGKTVYNMISLNLFWGYSGGLKGFEFSTFGSIIQQDMKGFQFAGFSNWVLGNVAGFQFSGLFNVSLRNMSGFQFAGLLNFAGGNIYGLHTAGLCNIGIRNSKVKGIQFSGITNIVTGNSSLTGLQFAGISNIVAGNDSTLESFQLSGIANIVTGNSSITGLQFAGITNIITGNSFSLRGFQMSGIANIAYGSKSFYGFQMSGLANILGGDVYGVQMSGIINWAREVKGIQIGLINVSREESYGSIGLININKNGYKSIMVSHGAELFSHLEWKSGGKYLYSIFSFGVGFAKKIPPMWSQGGGIGIFVDPRHYVAIECLIHSINIASNPFHDKNAIDGLNLWTQVRVLYNKEFSRFVIQAGPTFNFSWSRKSIKNPGFDKICIMKRESSSKDLLTKMWIGVCLNVGAVF